MRMLIAAIVLSVSAMCCPAQAADGRSPLGPGLHTRELSVDGLRRTYLVHVPARADAHAPWPVVIMLHGGGGTARGVMVETGWAAKAEKEGFLAVFPNALARDPSQPGSFVRNPQLWNDGSGRFYPGQKGPDDVRFIGAVLDDLAARLVLDERRIFAAGFSNGASMSFRLGAEMPQRIAAIAPVAGALWVEPPQFRDPVSMCYITGTADPLNPIEGGVPKLATGSFDRVRAKPKPPVRDSISRWARALGCPAEPSGTSCIDGVCKQAYSPCAAGAEVVYITVDGMGHVWPGGRSLLPESMVGPGSDKINATDVIWDFFNLTRSARLRPSARNGLVPLPAATW
jgi:polyhydroxybutyrate depolymerase